MFLFCCMYIENVFLYYLFENENYGFNLQNKLKGFKQDLKI